MKIFYAICLAFIALMLVAQWMKPSPFEQCVSAQTRYQLELNAKNPAQAQSLTVIALNATYACK